MKDRAYCCFHDDRETFKAALSDIRKILHIPLHKAKVCPMAICTCRTNATHRTTISVLKMDDYQGEFPTDVQLWEALNTDCTHSISTTTREFITSVLINARGGIENAFRLACVFKMAVVNEHTLLDEEFEQTKLFREVRTHDKKDKKVVKGKRAIQSILARRKRQAGNVVNTILNVKSGSVIYKYHADITALLQKTAISFRPCVVQPNKKKISEMNAYYVDSIPVKIWCEKKMKKNVVHELQRNMLLLSSAVSRIRPTRRKRFQDYENNNFTDFRLMRIADPTIIKERRSANYSQKMNKENSHHLTPLPGIKKTVKCYNCQESIKTLQKRHNIVGDKNHDGTIASKSTCHYHPGFVIDGKWSCCQCPNLNHNSIAKSHAIDGCVTGVHKWLYQDRSSKMSCRNRLQKDAVKYELRQM